MASSLKYIDEHDRSLGCAGMAISLVVMDGEACFLGVNLDSPSGSHMEMTSDFYSHMTASAGEPRQAWARIVRHYSFATSMTIGNAICRCLVNTTPPFSTNDLRRLLHDVAIATAVDDCGLHEDEADHIFTKTYNYLWRVFSHSGVRSVADRFARRLEHDRRLSRMEVLEELSELSML